MGIDRAYGDAMTAFIVCFERKKVSERGVLNACLEEYGAIDLTPDGSVVVLQTAEAAQQVFDEFRACLRPGAFLFVSSLATTPFYQHVRPGAEKLLGRVGGT